MLYVHKLSVSPYFSTIILCDSPPTVSTLPTFASLFFLHYSKQAFLPQNITNSVISHWNDNSLELCLASSIISFTSFFICQLIVNFVITPFKILHLQCFTFIHSVYHYLKQSYYTPFIYCLIPGLKFEQCKGRKFCLLSSLPYLPK